METVLGRLGAGWHPGVFRALPFALYILFLALNPLVARLFHAHHAPWLYGLQAGVPLLALLWLRDRFPELSLRATRVAPAAWVVAVLAGLAMFGLWIHLDVPLLSLGQGEGMPPPLRDGAPNAAWLALRLAGAALVVPVIEELFWRSLVLRWVDAPAFLAVAPASVTLRAMLLSSLAFGLEHALWFAGVLAGLAYAWLYRRYGALWLPVLAHGVTNLALGCWVIATGQWQFW